MIDFIFGFDRFRESGPISWHLTINNIWMFLGFVVAMIIFYYLFSAKDRRSIVISKLILIITLFVFEIGRMVWRYTNHFRERPDNPYYEPGPINWVRLWSFEICAVNVWITIGVLIATLVVASDNKTLVVFKNILFGSATIGGILSFMWPVHLSDYRTLLHWQNSQTIISHFLLVFVPFYLIKTKELEVKFKNFWMAPLGLVAVMTIVATVSHISGSNFSTTFGDRTIEPIIPAPFHLILIKFPIALLIAFSLYAGRIFYERKKYNINSNANDIVDVSRHEKDKMYVIIAWITGILLVLSTLFTPLLFGIDFFSDIPVRERYGMNSWKALILLIPLIIHVLTLYSLANLRNKFREIE